MDIYVRVDRSLDMITPQDLFRYLGRETWPLVFDVRAANDVKANSRFLPGARQWLSGARSFPASQNRKLTVVYCATGCARSLEAAAALRKKGHRAEILEGGIEGWLKAGGPSVGGLLNSPSRWVTRARPKIDRIACPWLIRRFLDPAAEVFYADPAKIHAEARKLKAVPFDIPGDAEYSHEGERCSFDYFIRHFEIRDPALDELAVIVRGADTARLDLAYPCAGLLGISLGLSALYPNDAVMLKKGMLVYDALYAWIRHARDERHNWPKGKAEKAA